MLIEENKIKEILKKFNSGKFQESFIEIEKLINKNKYNIDLIRTYGLMAKKIGNVDKAIKSFEYIIQKNPKDLIALHNLYSIFMQKKIYHKANKLIDIIIGIDKNHYEANRDKAYLAYLKKDNNLALKFIQKAMQINRNDVFGINIHGLIEMHKNEYQKAIEIFTKAILINKNYFDSYNNIGKCFFELDNLKDAFLYFKKSYRINPESHLPIINIGNILSLKDKNFFAIKFYKRALAIQPNSPDILSNLAICYCRVNDRINAKKYYKMAIKTDPNNADLKLAYSYFLIKLSDFEKGWDLFNSRLYVTKNFKVIKNLQNVKNKLIKSKKSLYKNKILVTREQGLGDEILFSSVYKDLLKINSNIKIEADKRLKKIFKRSFKKDVFYDEGFFSQNKNKLNEFDYIIYAGTLPMYFRNKKNDFKTSNYLTADQKKVDEYKSVMQKNTSLSKIGISWKSIVNVYGKLKSLTIEDFEPIFQKNRIVFSLQYGDVKNEIKNARSKNFNIVSFDKTDLYNDIEACMAILQNLDILVTVSSSIAHIAGAMGIRTIILCPKKSSTFYYWDAENKTSIWYNNVKVIPINESIQKTFYEVNVLINNLICK
ncbi:MAG: hypothetical protein CMI96_00390 [Pelagibacteraceae bacterium]|nr:hypothetical protein [Pelagibacteraceae bacterium]|tara:strand:- start:21412 stop:23208 length:1797 start_codon:yes stop_codon:yes gene_type:complete